MIHKAEVIKHLHWIIDTRNGTVSSMAVNPLGAVIHCPDGSEVILPQRLPEARKQAKREYYRVSRAQPW
jgi:hypothetical protein